MSTTTPQQALTNTQNYNITVLSTTEPCNKKVVLNKETGVPEKKSLAQITIAAAHTLEVPDAEALRHHLLGVSENPCATIALCSFQGRHANREVFNVLSKKNMRRALGLPDGAPTPDKSVMIGGNYCTTREKKNCLQSNWMCFDYDKVKGMPEELVTDNPEKWLGMMSDFVPGFSGADKVLVFSTSSRISYHDTHAFEGGWHCYVQAKDASDIESFGKRLLAHALTTKYGFMREIYSSETGEVVGHRPWTIFDPTTFSRERLLFEGKPTVEGNGLAVYPTDIQVIGGDV